MDKDYLLVSFNDGGKIDAAAFYRAPALDGFKAGQARATIAGTKKFQVYQIQHGEKDALSFSRVEKAKKA